MHFLFFIFLGLTVGSFLNAAIYRLRTKEFKSIFFGRSFCVHCKKTLHIKDLIPLLSFLLLRGKCRFCAKKISTHYFLVELTTALAFGAVVAITGLENLPLLIWNLFFTTIFIFLASYDAKFIEIPDEVSLPSATIALLGSFLSFTLDPSQSFIGALVGGGLFVGILLLNELALRLKWTELDWMGGGDIRFGLLLGALLGWHGFLVALLLASIIGSLMGGILIFQKKKGFFSPLPFGPFLALGGFVALFFTENIWNWYFRLFGWF
jgi:leader peptidase (prepilin peptidase) / N-methyltransferase